MLVYLIFNEIIMNKNKQEVKTVLERMGNEFWISNVLYLDNLVLDSNELQWLEALHILRNWIEDILERAQKNVAQENLDIKNIYFLTK